MAHKHINGSVRKQRGVTLIEVMIAVFITAIGLLGAAAMQLKALKYTDSSRLTSQASFVVYDIVDRMRAADPDNLDGYTLITGGVAGCGGICKVDVDDFIANFQSLPDGAGSITVNNTTVSVEVSWDEGRAGGKDEAGIARRGEFAVTTNVAVTNP